MNITRTVIVDGISVDLSITLTEDELRKAHHTYQSHLEAKADALDTLTTPQSAFMQNLLSAGICETEEEAGKIVREYFREHYAADLALNEEDTTDAE